MLGINDYPKSSDLRSFLSNKLIIVSALLIALITFLVYLPALQNGFVNWDDNLYVYENLNIRTLDLNFFRWVLTTVVAAPYHNLGSVYIRIGNFEKARMLDEQAVRLER